MDDSDSEEDVNIDDLLSDDDSEDNIDVEDTIVDLLTDEEDSNKNVNEASILEDENDIEINADVENDDLEDFFNEVEEDIEKICYKNIWRVWKATEEFAELN